MAMMQQAMAYAGPGAPAGMVPQHPMHASPPGAQTWHVPEADVGIRAHITERMCARGGRAGTKAQLFRGGGHKALARSPCVQQCTPARGNESYVSL
eukprot:111869-Chlamydomonas_euryale.AAC.3